MILVDDLLEINPNTPYPSRMKLDGLDFELPAELEASEPIEARGLERDEVRLMVSHISDDRVVHTKFRQIVEFLDEGDVLVINTSGTMNAALLAERENGDIVELHLSTRLPDDMWVIEVRTIDGETTKPFYFAQVDDVLSLSDGATVRLVARYNSFERNGMEVSRLWVAELNLPCGLDEYLGLFGFPIRYGYVKNTWNASYYQTVYANEVGSAEMPSAGRAFTTNLITDLVAKGVQIVPIILHTGVASLEDHEPPYAEYYRVPKTTANVINISRSLGQRIVAVGTTVVRALETATDTNGVTRAQEGWTEVIVTPQRGIHAVNAILTGLHEPKATHLAMLEALAGYKHLQLTYHEALEQRYLWHEFGDLHLILP